MIKVSEQPVFKASYTFRGRHPYYNSTKGTTVTRRYLTLRGAANWLAWRMIHDKYGTYADRDRDYGVCGSMDTNEQGTLLEDIQRRLARYIISAWKCKAGRAI